MFVCQSCSRLPCTRLNRSSVEGTCRLFVSRLLLILAAIGLFTGQSRGQEQEQDRVNQLKAVYLYNYGNYVTWPDSSFDDRGGLQPFVIGILDTEHPVEAMKAGGLFVDDAALAAWQEGLEDPDGMPLMSMMFPMAATELGSQLGEALDSLLDRFANY